MAGYKTYDTFDAFFADQPADKQKLVTALRELVAKTAPELEESSKWGNGTWHMGNLPVLYVHVEPDYVQLGFFGGAMLDDTNQVLEGKGKFIRHIKIRTKDDIDQATIKPLVLQAAKLNYKKPSNA